MPILKEVLLEMVEYLYYSYQHHRNTLYNLEIQTKAVPNLPFCDVEHNIFFRLKKHHCITVVIRVMLK